MNFEEINQIIDKFNRSSVRELEINEGDFHLHLSKNETSNVSVQHTTLEDVSKPSTKEDVQSHQENSTLALNQIKSPMVGTVYLQPEPGADLYVEPGKFVHVGDVVCVIEAMKMLTEVKSDVDCRIKSVLVENEDLVEFDQPLFEIEEI